MVMTRAVNVYGGVAVWHFIYLPCDRLIFVGYAGHYMANIAPRQNPRPPGQCIFCGRTGVTHEHLFSDWLRELFPRSKDDSHTLARLIAWTPRPTFSRRIKQGHSGTRTVRKICRRCNSGWLSLIDDGARNFAIPLIRGEAVTVTVTAQRALATWLAKIAMVANSHDPKTSVVLQVDRDWIRKQSLPPIVWQIWMGFYDGVGWRELAMQHHSGILHFTSVGDPETLSGYASATTLGLGRMLTLIVGTEFPNMEVNLGLANQMLRRIWPARDSFTWPLGHAITDDEAGAIARIIHEAVANPRPPAD
jgi:hypothetical protein